MVSRPTIRKIAPYVFRSSITKPMLGISLSEVSMFGGGEGTDSLLKMEVGSAVTGANPSNNFSMPLTVSFDCDWSG